MTSMEQLVAWVTRVSLADLTEEALQVLKMRLLDALGYAIGALDGLPIQMLREQLADFGGRPLVTLIGSKTAPDRAAMYNNALMRYLDFSDSLNVENRKERP